MYSDSYLQGGPAFGRRRLSGVHLCPEKGCFFGLLGPDDVQEAALDVRRLRTVASEVGIATGVLCFTEEYVTC